MTSTNLLKQQLHIFSKGDIMANEAIKSGQQNNDLMQRIVEYLNSIGIDLTDDDFEKSVNLIKNWEDKKSTGDKNEITN